MHARMTSLRILVRGAGSLATGTAIRLHRAGFHRICMLEREHPLSVHRMTSFSEAVPEGLATVEGITAALISHPRELPALWSVGCIGLLADPHGISRIAIRPDVCIDAAMQGGNGFTLSDASLIIAIGPGHTVGVHAHRVIYDRGMNLGRVLGIDPEEYGQSLNRDDVWGPAPEGEFNVHVYAPQAGMFRTTRDIGEQVQPGDVIGMLSAAEQPLIVAPCGGTLRGVLRDNTPVSAHMRLADIDPSVHVICHRLSSRAVAVGGGVLEAICACFNKSSPLRHGVLPLSGD